MDGASQHLVIVGAGLAGLCLALAADRSLGARARISVLDPGLDGSERRDARALAIAPASRRALQRLAVWDAVADRAQSVLAMTIAGARPDDPVRQGLLDFEPAPEGEPLAHMVEPGVLTAALREVVRNTRIELRPVAVRGFSPEGGRLAVEAGGDRLVADLLVGADGARSSVRGLAGIGWHGWDYGQTGLVTSVEHEFEHSGRARQHFLPGGPFAILPLPGRRSSIVWSEPGRTAERLLALDPTSFAVELERRFGPELGGLRVLAPPSAYPLQLRLARRFVGPGLALVGEAAHVVHPLAGQGFNLGMRDVAALAECLADTAALGLPLGDAAGLARYERWRRFDTVAAGLATDGLNRLFSNALPPLRLVREVGLGLMDRLPGVKRRLVAEAAGGTGRVPALMQAF